jgi:hypothetical protein
MKQDKNELNVDFIGGQGSLTKHEEIAISEFLKAKKAKHEIYSGKTNTPKVKRKKTIA